MNQHSHTTCAFLLNHFLRNIFYFVTICVIISLYFLWTTTNVYAVMAPSPSADSINSIMAVETGDDEVRNMLLEIHAQFLEQMKMADQLSAQNSSMLYLYQETVLPTSESQQSSINHSIAPLPTPPPMMLFPPSSQYSISSSSYSPNSASSSQYPTSSSSQYATSSSSSQYSSSSSSPNVSSSSSSQYSTSSSSYNTSSSSSQYSTSVSSSSQYSISSSSYNPNSSSSSQYPTSSSSQYATSSSSSQYSQSSSDTAHISALRESFGRTIGTLDAPKRELAYQLMKDLTLTPVGEDAVLTFVTTQLRTANVVPQYAASAFRSFKLLNGAELKKIGIVPNIDVDPKDWFAEPVATVNALGIMTGEGDTGLFAAERSMNQAELARTLANAMTLLRTEQTEQVLATADVYQQWPAWGKDAVSELRARGVDTSFLRANPLEPVNRVQLARAITDTVFQGEDIDRTNAIDFPDTRQLPEPVQEYIDTVSALGIMTGNPQTQTFDPYAETNRAQVAKTVMFAVREKVDGSSVATAPTR